MYLFGSRETRELASVWNTRGVGFVCVEIQCKLIKCWNDVIINATIVIIGSVMVA